MPGTVVIVTDHASNTGGIARVAIASACGLAARGRRVLFVAPAGPPDPTLIAAGVQVVGADRPDVTQDGDRLRAMAKGLWNRGFARLLTETLRDIDPQDAVLHLHGWSKAVSPAVGPVLARTALPTVVTLHDYFTACPNGAFLHYPDRAVCTRRPLGAACLTTQCDARRASHKAWRVLRALLTRLPGGLRASLRDVILLSETQERALRPHLPARIRTHRVANPIDAAPGPPAPVAENRDILFVGRLSPEKGGDVLARAAAACGDRLVFAGDGPQGDALRGLAPAARFLGWCDAAAVAAARHRARMLVFPSLWYECAPLVPREAQAAGVPPIVTAVSAAAEHVRDGEDGLVVPAGDVDALRAAIARLDDPAEAARMGSAAHAGYRAAPQTLDAHLDALEAVYAAAGISPP